tara:strand:+ start:741 stop:1505 length:765 start_codon:yes stop_codon:yes gene_type:complete
MYICIAGKNKCAVEAAKYLLFQKIKKNKILILPNSNDTGKNDWQPSLKKFANIKNIKITNLKSLYSIEKLIFLSLEYDKIINVKKFKSKRLFNFHFSLLPKYRGCHTNFFQLYNGEKYSGVTLHKIDNGIDTGNIIDQRKFKININCTGYENYLKLIKYSTIIFKKNLYKILNNKYKMRKQNLTKGSYYSRKSVDYNKISKIKLNKYSLGIHNRIRALIFPPYQLPIVNGVKIKKSIYKNKKVYLIESKDYKSR